MMAVPRSNPSGLPQGFPVVRPLCVFAAGRQSFKAVVIGVTGSTRSKAAIFIQFDLEASGWDFHAARITRCPNNDDDEPVWLLERK